MLAEMLNILEHFDVKGLGFGTVPGAHLLCEVMKLGFEDRNAYTGDPDFLDVPVVRLANKTPSSLVLLQPCTTPGLYFYYYYYY